MGIKFFKYLIIFQAVIMFYGASYDDILNDKKRQSDYIESQLQRLAEDQNEINTKIIRFKRVKDSIEAEINDLNNFLKNYENETYMTPDQIAIETNMIIYLAEEVERIQESFRKKVVNLYKHGKNYELELLFSSKSPNEYLRRNMYLQHFSQNRKKELRELKSKKFILEEKKKMLSLSTSSQRFYVEARRNEKSTLEAKLNDIGFQKENAEYNAGIISEKINRYETQLNNINNYINNFISNSSKFRGEKINRLNYSSVNLSELTGNLNPPFDIGVPLTGFGNYMNNATNTISFNNGIDYSLAKGSKIFAVAAGEVEIIGELPFYGKCIILKHQNGYRSVYASLSATDVNPGDPVKLNQVIGKSGETLAGQMIHFELWKDTIPLNPNQWLRR